MEVLNWLKATMEKPTPFGWFHLMMILITIIATTLVCVFFKNASDKKFRRIILVIWIIFIVFEIYKELTYLTDWEFDETGKLIGTSYHWYGFPFQFCSTPLYILPFIVFLPEGKVRNAFLSYASTFIFFAGFIVMLIPGDVFVTQIGINIQTMVHHGMQVLLGVYITVWNRKKYHEGFKNLVNYYWPGLLVFIGMAIVAIILNEIAHKALPDVTFNMFFISPYFKCTLPVLSNLWEAGLRGIPFIVVYIIGFSIISALFITFEWIFVVPFSNLIQKISHKKNA